MVSSFVDVLTPNLMFTALVPITEAYMNKSFFRDRALVSVSNEGKLAEYQYTQHTSETAKLAARLIAKVPQSHILSTGRSPIAIENYIAAWTGGLGKTTLWSIDQLFTKAGIYNPPPKPTTDWTEYPMIKSFFVRHPSLSAESIKLFYDHYAEGQRIAKTISGVERELNYEDIPMLLTRSDFGALNSTKAAMDNLSSVRNDILALRELDGMTTEQVSDWKREQLNIIIDTQIQLAKSGNEIYDLILNNRKSFTKEMEYFLSNGK